MPWKLSGTPSNLSSPVATQVVTVPSGVVATDSAIVVATGTTASPTSITLTTSGSGVITTLLAKSLFTNSWTMIWKVRGVLPGDTITCTTVGQQGYILTHDYISGDIDVVGSVTPRPSSGTTTNAPAIATTAGSSNVILVSTERSIAVTPAPTHSNDAGNTVSQRSFVEAVSGSVTSSVTVGEFVATGASSGITTTTYTTGSANGGAIHFREVAPAPVEVGVEVPLWNGTVEVTGKLSVYNGTSEVTPTLITTLKSGYPSVNDMLNTPDFKVAHRGGSINWPEMSLSAYTQCVTAGYGALEISLSRTIDGVWFGLHDQFLDRTSGVTGSKNPLNMTWREVQQYSILASGTDSPGQGSQPYMTLHELLAVYGQTHVLFIDAKYLSYNQTTVNEITQFLSRVTRATDRIVAKGAGSGTNPYTTTMKAAGFKTWGFYYQDSANQIPANADRWDIIGMDYSADQVAWDTATSFGKPVMGHICPNVAAVNTARSKGAVGFMVSGVKQVG